jgi:hypothetical protein
MGFVILCVLWFGAMCLMVIFSKYVFAIISILSGDKESLQEFGNVCDKNIPWKDQKWSYWEKRK